MPMLVKNTDSFVPGLLKGGPGSGPHPGGGGTKHSLAGGVAALRSAKAKESSAIAERASSRAGNPATDTHQNYARAAAAHDRAAEAHSAAADSHRDAGNGHEEAVHRGEARLHTSEAKHWQGLHDSNY